MKRRASGALLVLTLILPVTPAAQQPQTEMISKALVELLLESYGYPGDAVRLAEGLPADFDNALMPDGAVARISMQTPRSTTVVAEVPGFKEGDRPRFERKIAAGGWAVSGERAYARGLTMSATSAPAGFCKQDQYASYTTSPKPGGGVWLRLSIMTVDRYNPCNPENAYAGPYASTFEAADLPEMPPPPGSRVNGMSSGGGDGVHEQRVFLVTSLTPSEVADYYEGLLANNGWTLDARAEAKGLTLARFSPKTSKGAFPVINTMVMPEGDMTVTLQVFAAKRQLP